MWIIVLFLLRFFLINVQPIATYTLRPYCLNAQNGLQRTYRTKKFPQRWNAITDMM